MLQRGTPKLGKDGKPMKDKRGKVIYEPYRIKVLNTINFKKSMHYNPFAYIHSEKDILKLVTTLIANTKGEGKAGDDFWVKAETLLYCALIGYIHYEAPVEEQNFSTLSGGAHGCHLDVCRNCLCFWVIYGYECKRHHDTPRIRLQNEQGNPTPICEIKPVGQSKLELMASKIFERVWGDQREIVLQTCKMLDACYKPDADRRADLMKAKDDSIQLLQQQLDDLVVVCARGEIEQDKFLQRTIEIQQQMEALRQSKAQIASEDYNPGRLDMEAIEAALCEAVEMHDGLVSEDFIDLFVSQVTPLSDSRFAWCLDFSPQPTVAFLNLAGQRKYTTCSMDSKLHFGPFADEEGHTIPFPGSLRR